MSIPTLPVTVSWQEGLDAELRARLEAVLPGFLVARRWFGGKARRVTAATFQHALPFATPSSVHYWAIVLVDYADAPAEAYALTLGASGSADVTGDLVATARDARGRDIIIFESFQDPEVALALLQAIETGRDLVSTAAVVLRAHHTRAFGRLRGAGPLLPRSLGAEQSNTSLLFGDRLIFKIFRRVEPGANPDLEIGRYLTEQRTFAHTPAVAGWLEVASRAGGEPLAVAILQQAVPNEGDAWEFTLRALAEYSPDEPAARRETATGTVPAYVDAASLLGRRTAELHVDLAATTDDPAFAPEPFTAAAQSSLGNAIRNLVTANFDLLQRRLGSLEGSVRTTAAVLLDRRAELDDRVRDALAVPFTALRTRIHGDYHLGQVLRSGNDFVIIDFEGEPAVPLAERREKHSPLRDVAGMVRSFHYAAHQGLSADRASHSGERLTASVADGWFETVSSAFLDGYFAHAQRARFLPASSAETNRLLSLYLLQKAVYELGYELNNRPTWVWLPMAGIARVLDGR